MAYSPVKAWPVMNLDSVDMVARVVFAASVWVVPSRLEWKGFSAHPFCWMRRMGCSFPSGGLVQACGRQGRCVGLHTSAPPTSALPLL
jgi:hypothetical protein